MDIKIETVVCFTVYPVNQVSERVDSVINSMSICDVRTPPKPIDIHPISIEGAACHIGQTVTIIEVTKWWSICVVEHEQA